MPKHNYQLVCGMEVHAELKTNSKMFCGCKNDPFNAPQPNIYTCPVCLGMPGGLPVPNQTAIEWTIKLGLALNCQINLFSKFDRKHYFYPDLPKGYQISQYDIPFCYDGYLETSQGRVSIERIHLEEDTGKLLHTELNGEKVSLVDFNRGGVPLLEIVTRPDIKSAAQAAEYGRKLRQIIQYLDIGDCQMQEGGMRLEANLSLSTDGELPDYKVELKNINSFKFMEEAIAYEIKRQAAILDTGSQPIQETRGWNTHNQTTFSQRTKEAAADYRYFPDPDIPPIRFTQEQVAHIKQSLPELPDEVLVKWINQYQIEERYAVQLIKTVAQTEYLEAVFKLATANKIASNDLAKELVNKDLKLNLSVPAEKLIKQHQQLHQTAEIDESELDQVIQEVIASHQDAVLKYRAGETQVIGFFMGQVSQKIGKKIDMKLVRERLFRVLTRFK